MLVARVALKAESHQSASNSSHQSFLYRLHFISNCLANYRFETAASEVLAQRVVDERLIVATAHFMHPPPEVIEDLVVQAYRDPCLAGVGRHYRTALAFAEIVLAFHKPCFSYSARSRRVARRADLMHSPRML